MRIVRAVLTPFGLALRAPVETAHGRIVRRRGVLVALHTAGGRIGIGEASPVPGFDDTSPEATLDALVDLAESLLSAEEHRTDLLLDALAASAEAAPAARFALDTALHDLAAQSAGLRLAALLAGRGGTPRAEVEVNALVAERDPARAGAVARRAADEGFGTLKLKVALGGLEEDVRRLAAVRAAVGGGVRLRVDANGGWKPEAAIRALQALAEFDLELAEQPVPADDVAGLARVRAAVRVPIAADEAAADPRSVSRLLAARAADFVVLKPAVLGGLRPSLRLAGRARAAGVGVIVTSGLDGAVARAAALALAAALPGDLPACGLATADLLAEDVAPSLAPVEGRLRLPAGPGLGVEPTAAALARVAEGPSLEVRGPCG